MTVAEVYLPLIREQRDRAEAEVRELQKQNHRLRAENETLQRELDLSDLRLDSVERAGFLAK